MCEPALCGHVCVCVCVHKLGSSGMFSRELLWRCVCVCVCVCASLHTCVSAPECLYVGDCVIFDMCVSTWQRCSIRAHMVFLLRVCVCACVRELGIMILPELPCCLPLCSDPVPWCTAAIQGSVLAGGQLGIIGTK